MGYLEATVVVYLRTAIDAGAVTPAQDPATLGTFEALEVVREAATLVMLAGIGWLAGRTRLERLAWAAVVFGLWDIVYYVGLRLTIGWPSTLDTWDVLFLVPIPWVGPVWAPIGVSGALIGVGFVAARRLRHGLSIALRPGQVAAAFVGGCLVIASFLVDSNRVLAGDVSPWTGWPLYWIGMGLAAVATAISLIRSVAPEDPGIKREGT
jgi:hypothetical protein